MIELTVCIGTSCHLRGAEKVIKIFQDIIKTEGLEKKINLKGTFCMGQCSGENVMVSIDSNIFETTPEKAASLFHSQIRTAVK